MLSHQKSHKQSHRQSPSNFLPPLIIINNLPLPIWKSDFPTKSHIHIPTLTLSDFYFHPTKFHIQHTLRESWLVCMLHLRTNKLVEWNLKEIFKRSPAPCICFPMYSVVTIAYDGIGNSWYLEHAMVITSHMEGCVPECSGDQFNCFSHLGLDVGCTSRCLSLCEGRKQTFLLIRQTCILWVGLGWLLMLLKHDWYSWYTSGSTWGWR